MAANVPIRTIYVAPVNSDIKGDIEKYFVEFGKVEKSQFVKSKKSKNSYCLVQFETIEGAKAALKNENHCILNVNVKVKAAHDRFQPDSKENVGYEQADNNSIWKLSRRPDSDYDEFLWALYHHNGIDYNLTDDNFTLEQYHGPIPW